MRLNADQVTNDEVRTWRGLHLLHFSMSSCSQKVRILLREKEVDWTSHPINLVKGEQKQPWFTSINPNAVVPVLVHDGAVHVESNDILAYLEDKYPSPEGGYLPVDAPDEAQAKAWLDLEDQLHSDLRTLTFTFVAPGGLMKGGPSISDDMIDGALERFRTAFEKLDAQLGSTLYLCGDRFMLPDIAWVISVHRLALGGYPLERHPNLERWYHSLLSRPSIAAEVTEGHWLPVFAGKTFRLIKRVAGASIRDRLSA